MKENNQLMTTTEQVQLQHHAYSRLIPKKFVLESHQIKLTKPQIQHLIGCESEPHQLFSQNQKQEIKSLIDKSPQKCLFIKLMNRTPKDLNGFLQKIHNIDDLITIVKSSEYLLEQLQLESEHPYLYLREFRTQIFSHKNHYEVYVKDGVTLAIAQRFHDHIEQQPDLDTILTILNTIQIILPSISITLRSNLPQTQKVELNCFVAKVHSINGKIKILGIHNFPDFHPLDNHSLITQEELKQFYNKKVVPRLTGKKQQEQLEASESIYDSNQNIEPIIKVIKSEEDLKKYDMGEYQMGNQIKNEEMLGQWKNFIKEAQEKLKQK